MKKTKEKPPLADSIDGILAEKNYVPSASIEKLTDEHIANLKKKKNRDGSNNSFDTLGMIAKRLIEYYRAHVFSYETFLTLAQPFDLDINEDGLRDFWNSWLIMLQGEGRILITPSDKSAYNFSTYQFR